MAKKSVTAYTDAIKSFKLDAILKATKQEASRQVQEMEKWKNYHQKYDPYGMADMPEMQAIFEKIDQARKYRTRIYNRNREINNDVAPKFRVAQEAYEKSQSPEDAAKVKELQDRSRDLTDEQIKWSWRIMKIYCIVRNDIDLTVGDGTESDPFDFEYDERLL